MTNHAPDGNPGRAGLLRRYLLEHGAGPFREIPSDDIRRVALAVGASVDQLKRAKQEAGVISVKKRDAFEGGWVWRLEEAVPETSKGAKRARFEDIAARFAPFGAGPAVSTVKQRTGRRRNTVRDQRIRDLYEDAVREHGPDLRRNGGPGKEAVYRAIGAAVGCHDNTVSNSLRYTAGEGAS
ncbi:hypothetical protein [Streptomyces sp. NPDC056401]|uniref:hypothetical protein n=1 Tax=Streptomyces sp. NPDC056401 TaxID=3345809 RepID=UPI0035D5C686